MSDSVEYFMEKHMKKQVRERHYGLKVFKEDTKLEDEVIYNGCGFYELHDKDLVVHFYTDMKTKSTFSVQGRPSPETVQKALGESRVINGYDGGAK